MLSSRDTILKKGSISTLELTSKTLKKKGIYFLIDVFYDWLVKQVTENGVIIIKILNILTSKLIRQIFFEKVKIKIISLSNIRGGQSERGNVVICATDVDPHEDLTTESQLHQLKGYYRERDCNTLENYQNKDYPTKAGFYAVREGPIIAKNLIFKWKAYN